MLCNFTTFNHCADGQRAVRDVFDIMGAQLKALGHEVYEQEGFLPGYNFIAESFADPRFPALPNIIASKAAGSCRFICVATERPGTMAFNDAPDQGMLDRQQIFPEAMKHFDAILHLVPGNDVTAWYSCFRPAAYAELGYAPGLMRDDGTEPTFDFGFFGKRTPRREAILDRLQRYGSLITVHDFAPGEERDRQMRKAKIIVQIREHEATPVCSSSRCCTALSLGRPVIAEPHPAPGVWGEIVWFAPSIDAFLEDAARALTYWRQLHEVQLAKFKERMTPERCVGAPLRSVGIS